MMKNMIAVSIFFLSDFFSLEKTCEEGKVGVGGRIGKG